jgi:hypothetical protein
MKLKPS